MPLPPNTEILETLGEGSFGAVYVALLSDGAIQRTVVLKVLKPQWASHPEILMRSRDEAALLARLNHNNIVRVEQLTDIDGRPAVVMEHVQGLTLDRLLKRQGPLPVSVAVSVASKVASALDAAYNQRPPGSSGPLRVVHRDIKPSNIIISVSGAVKVLDFGTARAEFGERGASTSALTLGSPLYMAPECFDGAEAHPTVDMYALGATLYELLAGVPMGRLSVHPTKHGVRLNERLEQLASPELARGGPVLKAVRNLIGRCMRYEAGRRPTASDMRRLCNEFLKRLPRGSISMDQFAQVTIEPLYNSREQHPPIPLDATLGRSGVRELGSPNSDSSEPWAKPLPQALPAPTPAPQPTPIARPTPAPQPAPPAQPAGAPQPAPAPLPQYVEEEGPGMGRLIAFGVIGVLLGLAVVGGILMLVVQGAQEPTESPATTPQAQEQPLTPPELAAEEVAPLVVQAPSPKPVKAPTVAARVQPEPQPEPEPEVEVPDEPVSATRVQVRVASVPAGARIRVGGESVQAPGTLSLRPGSVNARVSFPDSSGGSCVVRVAEGARWLFRADSGSVVCP